MKNFIKSFFIKRRQLHALTLPLFGRIPHNTLSLTGEILPFLSTEGKMTTDSNKRLKYKSKYQKGLQSKANQMHGNKNHSNQNGQCDMHILFHGLRCLAQN